MKRDIKIRKMNIDGVLEIETESKKDERGYLISFYDQTSLGQFQMPEKWVAEYLSFTSKKNTLRGLHVSLPPNCESKIVLAISGATQWVVVDLRKGSNTFGEWESLVVSAEKHNALFVTKGFAHGCISLTNNAELLIKADNNFSDEKSTGIIWNDPELAIKWNLDGTAPMLSTGHQKYGSFKDFVKNIGALDI